MIAFIENHHGVHGAEPICWLLQIPHQPSIRMLGVSMSPAYQPNT